MSNLLKAEFYKLFHSWYFWGIGLFNLLLSSVLLLDSVGETSNLFFASIYNMPILYFLTIIFSALFVGNDFGRRTLQSYINAGHRRGKILFAKLVVHQIACMVILSFPLLLHSIIGTFVTKGALASIGIVVMVIASQFAMCLLPFFFAKDRIIKYSRRQFAILSCHCHTAERRFSECDLNVRSYRLSPRCIEFPDVFLIQKLRSVHFPPVTDK